MKNNYRECLILIKELSGRELVELSHKVAQTIYVKSLMEHIEIQKMQPLIEELAKQINQHDTKSTK